MSTSQINGGLRSSKVWLSPNEKLEYDQSVEAEIIDKANNLKHFFKHRLPDFSYAGYQRNNQPIPQVPVLQTIGPGANDCANIQEAIDFVSHCQPDPITGFRGAIKLLPGVFEIFDGEAIKVSASGVVIYGSGSGDNPATDTIVKAYGKESGFPGTVFQMGISKSGNHKAWVQEVPGKHTQVTSPIVDVDDLHFEVEDPSDFTPGDLVVLLQPVNETYLKAIRHGGIRSDQKTWVSDWPRNQPITVRFLRRITFVDGNRIGIEAPIYYNLIKSLSQPVVYKFDGHHLRQNIGIENMRIDIQYDPKITAYNAKHKKTFFTDDEHRGAGIVFENAENAWARNCVILHASGGGIVTDRSIGITIENCKALDFVSTVAGGYRYGFRIKRGSQLIRVSNCHVSCARHAYITVGGAHISGIVFHKCTFSEQINGSEAHGYWSQGVLFDNIKELDKGFYRAIMLNHKGRNENHEHGWGSVNSVMWNCEAHPSNNIIVQKPPTSQNYAIGCKAKLVTGNKKQYPKIVPVTSPEGFIEFPNEPAALEIPSLFEAQLNDRLTQALS